MRPLAEFPADAARSIDFLLTDIDDTITTDGKLPAASYSALWDLHDAGIKVIPVTGRPAGWCDLIARQWPVDGVVGENGAFVLLMDGDHQVQVPHPAAPDPEANRQRLREIAQEAYRAVPGCRPAKDQFSRLYDIAVDFREEPPFLDLDSAESIRAVFASHGAHAKVSSIHVNAWFGEYDKLSMAAHFLRDRFGVDISEPAQNRRIVYCGDSPNDEPMFARFELSIGVSNIRDFEESLTSLPAFVTHAASSEGFIEAVRHILSLRHGNPRSHA